MLSGFLKRHGWRYLPGIIFMVVSSYIQSLAPTALGRAIDLLADKESFNAVLRQALLIVAIAGGVFVTRFIWRLLIIGAARILENHLRRELFLKFLRLPVSYFVGKRSGDLMAYAINDVGAIRMTFGPGLAMGINGVVLGTLSIVGMINEVDPRMTITALIPVPIAVFAIIYIGKKVRVRFRRVQQLFSNVSGHVNETINGVRVIKSFAREEERLNEFDDLSNEMRDANVKLANASSTIQPVVAVVFGLCQAIALIYGSNMVISGELSIGSLAAFNAYLLLIQGPVTQLGRIVNVLQRGMASFRRLYDIYNEPEIPAFELNSANEYTKKIKGAITVKNLSFTYPDGNKALKNVSFSLPAGGMLGIVGGTGSGKSTIASLLVKLYTPERGRIFIDGDDIVDIPAAAIREITGYVPQDGFLFNGTISYNIGFYNKKSKKHHIRSAALISGVDADIMEFPYAYDTEIGERGTRLSGGQKQRVALARAIIRDPQIIILDDTLSAVDSHTERYILDNLKKELEGRTSMVITHRLSAVRDADHIIFLKDGEIVEEGTHERLMELNGQYARIYHQQQRS